MRKIVLGILGTVFCTLVVSNADAACPPGWREANVTGGGITCVRAGTELWRLHAEQDEQRL
jgi:hypothetical protein